jgi:hypothetical protein
VPACHYDDLLWISDKLEGPPFPGFFFGVHCGEDSDVVGAHLRTDILDLMPDQSEAIRRRRDSEPADRPSTVYQLLATE